MLVLQGLPASAQSGTAAFEEDWSDGTDGWMGVGLGMSVDCEAPDACALHVEPPCCSVGSTLWRAADIPLAGMIAFDIAFRAESLRGDTDTNVILTTDAGAHILLHPTESTNNGLTLQTDQKEHRDFGSYDEPGEWMALRVLIDGDAHLAQAQLLGADGRPVSASRALPFGAGSVLARVEITGVTWTTLQTGFDYGALSIARTAATFESVACEADAYLAAPSLPEFEVEFWLWTDAEDEFTWQLDFGDGNATGGTGPAPTKLSYRYERSGDYRPRLTVTCLDGATDAHTVWLRATAYDSQVVEGRVDAAVRGVGILDSDAILLEEVAGTHARATLTWDAPLADLDVLFYDAGGDVVGPTDCAWISFSPTVRCKVPPGAAFAQVKGTGALAAWTFTYDHRP